MADQMHLHFVLFFIQGHVFVGPRLALGQVAHQVTQKAFVPIGEGNPSVTANADDEFQTGQFQQEGQPLYADEFTIG